MPEATISWSSAITTRTAGDAGEGTLVALIPVLMRAGTAVQKMTKNEITEKNEEDEAMDNESVGRL
jgi:hypothetical protein